MALQKKVNKLQVEHVSEEEVDQVRVLRCTSRLLPHANAALSCRPRARVFCAWLVRRRVVERRARLTRRCRRRRPQLFCALEKKEQELDLSPTGIRRTWSRRSSLHGGCSARVATSSPNMWRSTITTTRRTAKTRRSPTQSRKPPPGGLPSSIARANTNQCARHEDDDARALGECVAHCDRASRTRS